MDGNRLMQQVIAIFSIFMVIFYLGVGWYFIFYSNLSYLNKPVRVIMGSALIFYGIYRAFRTYFKIVEVFFTKEKDDE
jgi:cytochrome c biogenesis protein CcdA